MNPTRTYVIIAALWLLPGLAMAQPVEQLIERAERAGLDQTLLERMSERAEEGGLAVAETSLLIEPAVVLAEQDLPARAVVQLALEGLAKGVSPDRIASALERYQRATEEAGRTGDAWLGRPEVERLLGSDTAPVGAEARTIVLESLAQAMVREVPAEALEAALERLPEEVRPGRTSVTAVGGALQVLPDLPTSLDEPKLTARLLAQALNSGFSASDLRRLPAAFEAARRQGELPAETIARGTISQLTQGTPAATILEHLFQGQIPGQPPGGTPPGLEHRPGGTPGGPPNLARG